MNLSQFNLESQSESGMLFSMPFGAYNGMTVKKVKAVLVSHPFFGKCGASDMCEIIKEMASKGCSCRKSSKFMFGFIDGNLYLYVPKCESKCDITSTNVMVTFIRKHYPIASMSSEIDFPHANLFRLSFEKARLERNNQLTSHINKQIELERKRLGCDHEACGTSKGISKCCP